MPALINQQFYLFRDKEQPVGLALWAKCNPEAERKLEGGMIEPENRLTLEEWSSGDKIWLVDLVAPFATNENKQREIMIADLISGPLAGKAFNMHVTDPNTGERKVQIIPLLSPVSIVELCPCPSSDKLRHAVYCLHTDQSEYSAYCSKLVPKYWLFRCTGRAGICWQKTQQTSRSISSRGMLWSENERISENLLE